MLSRQVEVCACPNAYSQLEFANSLAVEMQEWFEDYHNISYPLSKMSRLPPPHAQQPTYGS